MKTEEIGILIVDDEASVRDSLYQWFKADGYRVDTAEEATSALKKLQENPWDIILLDIILPKQDGFAVLRQLKADRSTAKVPVILLTNLSQKDEIEQGLRLGAEDYLIKAYFMPSEVVEKIKKVLNK